MAAVADFTIHSLLGGMNDSDPSISLPNDQCVLARNIEYVNSMLGERRLGTDNITLTANLSNKDRITFLYRHVPGTDDTGAELWAFGHATSGPSGTLARKTTSWSDVTMPDAATLTGFSPYQWSAVSLHGKLFIAYDSSVNRLHVATGSGATTLRRVGIAAASAAPTGANTAGAGSFSGTRYYRVRFIEKSGSTILLRSEPSATLTHAPSGTKTGVTVTRPTAPGDSETHWELEASLDNVNFYNIAEVAVATTTSDDTTDIVAGYAQTYELSEDIEDYALIPSVRYLIADEDRLVGAGSWEDSALSSRVMWTPVGNAEGTGNDERLETDTSPAIDLDGLDGGPITGMASASSGEIFVFKTGRIYKLVRQGVRLHAYDTICLTKARGALHGSVINGVDQQGRPCIYFLDPNIGPCRAGVGGIKQCGSDIFTTWNTINLEATKVVCCGVFYPAKNQVIWNIATGSANIPDMSIVLHTSNMRDADDGLRKGWVTWTGTRSAGLSICLFADNIETGAARSRSLVPFIGTEGLGLIHQCDQANDDNGVAYAARIVTKPYTLKGLLYRFGVKTGALLAKAVTGAKITMKIVRDWGLETPCTVTPILFDASASETEVIKVLDQLAGSEMRVAQFEMLDTSPAGTQWQINQVTLIETPQGNNQ